MSSVFSYGDFLLFSDLAYWDRPQHLSIEVTNRCNLRCTHCFQSYFSFPRGDLLPEVWKKIQPELPYLRSVSLSSAGEPLLTPNFQQYLETCLDFGISVGFTTNAHLLENWLERLVGRLRFLSVSLDAISEEGYRLRRRASLRPVVSALRRLKVLKEASGTKYPELSLIVVLNRENVSELPDLVRFGGEIEARYLYVYHQIFYSEEEFRHKSLWFDKKSYDLFLKEALRQASRRQVKLIHPGSFGGEIPPHPATSAYLTATPNGFFCQWIFNTSTVSWNGFVQACCFCDRLFMGTLLKDDLFSVWNGPAYRFLRLQFLKRQVPTECRNCQFLQVVSLNRNVFLCPHREENFYHERALLLPKSSLSYRLAEKYYQRGLSLLHKGNFEGASKEFSILVEKEPLYFEGLNALAVSLALQGKKYRARELLAEALNIFPREKTISQNWRILKD